MPNRILKDSIITSKKVGGLSDFHFRLWAYLIVYADDYGRAPADPELLKGQVFTRRKGVTETQIREGLSALANAGMIEIYDVDGESYLYFPNWQNHQRIQAKRAKYPNPPSSTVSHRESPSSTVSHRESPLESNTIQSNPIQYESESKSESKYKEDPFAALAGDDMELLEALNAYADMRKRIKKPLTARSKGVICKKLTEFRREQWVQIVDQATEKCWLGFYPLEQVKTAQPDRPASYDISAADVKAKTSVPQLKKRKEKRE